MSFQDTSNEMVGKISRGDLYRELALATELLDLANSSMLPQRDGGVSAACEIAQRMLDDLAMRVSP